jgi:hypothetical protein
MTATKPDQVARSTAIGAVCSTSRCPRVANKASDAAWHGSKGATPVMLR